MELTEYGLVVRGRKPDDDDALRRGYQPPNLNARSPGRLKVA